MTALIGSVIDTLLVSYVKLKQIIETQDEDEICKQFKQYCLEEWPGKHQRPSVLKPCWNERGELSVNRNVILKSSRILIPFSMRREVLDKIHQGHQGITKCTERAKQAVWWPSLSRQIHDMIESCRTCAKHRINKPEPLCLSPFLEGPWQVLGTDLFYS